MSGRTEEIREHAQKAIANPVVINDLIDDLNGDSRRNRQFAASVFSEVSKTQPEILVPHVEHFVNALDNLEAQTRWESLEVLTRLVPFDSRGCDRAVTGAEDALFEGENGILHLAAIRFLAALGGTTKKRSEKVWPLLDEAIQCYHGNPEFPDMLVAIVSFSEGKLQDSVKDALKARMLFDATNGKESALQRRARVIVANVS